MRRRRGRGRRENPIKKKYIYLQKPLKKTRRRSQQCVRVSCEAAAKWRHCRSLEPARVGWLAACLLGGRTREKKKNHHHHYSPVVVSAAPLPPTNKRSSRSAAAAHWRTRSSEPSAQSQDPQSPQPIRGYTGGPGAAGGWGKKKKGKKRRKTTAGRPVSLHRPPSPTHLHSALPPSRHEPRGRTPQRALFFSVSLSPALFLQQGIFARLCAPGDLHRCVRLHR